MLGLTTVDNLFVILQHKHDFQFEEEKVFNCECFKCNSLNQFTHMILRTRRFVLKKSLDLKMKYFVVN